MTKQNSFWTALVSIASWIAMVMCAPVGFMPDVHAQGAGCGGSGQLSNVTNSGTEFLLCFEQNYQPVLQASDSAYLNVYVATLGQSGMDTITITTNADPSIHRVFILPPNQTATYRISDANSDLWMTSHEVADPRVVRVVATAPIVCYGMNYKYATADGFLALPKSSAGTDYRIMSYPNSNNPVIFGGVEEMPSQFAVAAFDDNTTVTITPKAPTLGGHAQGAPFTITLNAGQGVQVQTDANVDKLDLTGSEVRADKPVAVYGSHARAEVPHGYLVPPINISSSRDILLEAMPPVDAWGNTFVLDALSIDNKGTKRAEGDLMRVLAINANTIVKVNGVYWTTLGPDQFADSLITGPVIVESSQPTLLGEYAHTSDTPGNSDNGDPFLAIVPSVDQTYNSYTFFIDPNPVYTVQEVVIATDVAAESSIVYDGSTTIPSAAFTPLVPTSGGRNFAITSFGVQPGAHTLSTNQQPQNGFTILAYGLGQVVSYGYTAGLLLKPRHTIVVNPLPQIMNGGRHSNEIDFHNMTNATVYFDSAVFTPTDNEFAKYGIHTKENVAYDIGTIGIAQASSVHLVSDETVQQPVSGMLRIYTHTPLWTDILPSETPVTYYPDAVAGVSNGTSSALFVSSYPNPFSTSATISFSLPSSGDLSIVLYDELGRVVRTIASGEFPGGLSQVKIARHGLPAGVYSCELVSERLNIKQRVTIVAGE
ncbi:MAG TPA: T9SS type A sorting domain-containing protein [Candidatus Kapabacteria bacterium]|jgi:hypothetical protein|nr:T9SS type A sorting domain-containing protein [Candidatus Kapabacteria bacterium]